MRQRIVSALLVVGFSALTAVAGAQPVYTHAVQEGDTLASIAQRYYADPTREVVLREANRMKGSGGSGLVAGSWIFIPMVSSLSPTRRSPRTLRPAGPHPAFWLRRSGRLQMQR